MKIVRRTHVVLGSSYNHNYLALIDGAGVTISEIHGTPTNLLTGVAGDTYLDVSGGYLAARITGGAYSNRNVYNWSEDYRRANKADYNDDPQITVFEGSDDAVKGKWNALIDDALQIDSMGLIYTGAGPVVGNPYSSDIINSNTFERTLSYRQGLAWTQPPIIDDGQGRLFGIEGIRAPGVDKIILPNKSLSAAPQSNFIIYRTKPDPDWEVFGPTVRGKRVNLYPVLLVPTVYSNNNWYDINVTKALRQTDGSVIYTGNSSINFADGTKRTYEILVSADGSQYKYRESGETTWVNVSTGPLLDEINALTSGINPVYRRKAELDGPLRLAANVEDGSLWTFFANEDSFAAFKEETVSGAKKYTLYDGLETTSNKITILEDGEDAFRISINGGSYVAMADGFADQFQQYINFTRTFGDMPEYGGIASPLAAYLDPLMDFTPNAGGVLEFNYTYSNALSTSPTNSDLFDALKAIGLGPNGIIGGTYFTDEELDMLARVRVATTREELDATGKRIATEVRQDLGLELGDVVARDSSGRIILENGKPKIVGKDIFTENGGRVRTYTDGPLNGITRIDIAGAFIDFRDAGAILGNLLGKSLAGDNKLAQVALSTTLKTVGNALGSALNGSVTGASQQDISRVFDSMGREFVRNLQLKGAGAVSAYLASEIVNVLGIDGFVGELTSTAAGEFLRSAVTNFLGVANNNIAFNVGNAIGALIGSKLASKVHQFHSVGGQIGAQIGAVVGNILLGGAIGTFLGQLIGGTIGSIFGGTPRSGADVQWDETMGAFTVANVWSKKGGSKEAAKGIAQSVANTYNGLVATIGGELLDPDAIQAGNYGMRSTKFVYRPISSRDKDDITATFKGKDAPEDLINYGLLQGFSDPDFLIAGGDILAKRAFYRTVELADNSDDFQAALVGNIATAQSYRNYLRNAPLINAIIAGSAETQDSEFAAEVAMTLIHADELGLNRRHWSDWIGGYSWLLEAAGVTAGTVTMRYEIDPFSQRLERVYDLGYGAYNPRDVIDVAGQDIIEGTSAADTINLTGGQIADVRNLTVNGKVQNDIAVTGSDFTHKTGTLSFATGDLRQAFYVSVVNDGVTEVAETLLASLSNASGMTIMGGAATITVRNANAGVPQLLVGKSYAYEGDGYAVFRVSLSKAASGAVSLSFALSDGRAAGQGVDYTAAGMQVSSNGTSWTTASTATLTAGMTQMFVRVPVKTDALNEGAEDFRLTATVTTGASYVATTTASNTGTILNGASATPLVWIDDVVVDEATGAATVTVSRNKTAATVNTVQYATQDRRTKTIGIAATVDGGAGNDRIDASDLGDNILGGAGDDTLYGGRLDDWLFGGDGNDILNAGAADTTKLGGDGNYLDGGAGNDTLTGREGSDWLEGGAGNDTLAAQGGDDILGGGAGVDTLQGGDGSDQYMLRRGDGADTVTDDPGTATTSTDPVTTRLAGLSNGSITRDWLANGVYSAHGAPYGGGDSLVLGPGIGMGDIQLMRGGTNNMDLILKVYTTVNGVKTLSGDQITLKEWFNSYKKVEWLVFADGQAIRIGDITSFIIGTADNDVIVGTTGNDFVVGGAGDDTLYGGRLDDWMFGGDGNDVLNAGAADANKLGGDGNYLDGGAGNDTLTGREGSDWLEGGAGNDTLAAQGGDDILGGKGNMRWQNTFNYHGNRLALTWAVNDNAPWGLCRAG